MLKSRQVCFYGEDKIKKLRLKQKGPGNKNVDLTKIFFKRSPVFYLAPFEGKG